MSGRKAKFTLPSGCTVERVAMLQSSVAKLLKGKNDVVFDVQRIKSIDTAGLQLMLVVKKALIEQSRNVVWTRVPEELERKAKLAGFETLWESEC